MPTQSGDLIGVNLPLTCKRTTAGYAGHVRATVGNSNGYSCELIGNCCLTTTLRGHAAPKKKKKKKKIIVHHNVSSSAAVCHFIHHASVAKLKEA